MTELMETEEKDDPVIKEIPVYLSQALAEKLYIFQYPIKPAKDHYDNANIIQALIKPKNEEVQLEIALDIDSPNYDKSRGRQIVLNVDGSSHPSEMSEDEERIFDSDTMDKTTLQSIRAIPDCSSYSVGIFQDGELHITPVKSILQLRPHFNYLEKESKKKGQDDAAKKQDGLDSDEEEAKQVNVTFARQKSEYSKKLQEQSFQQHSKKSLEEKWIETNYLHSQSTQAELTRLEMFCSSTEETSNSLKLSCAEYVKQLTPAVKMDEHSKSSTSNVTSLSYILTLPLLDQIRSLMKDAKVLSFAQLRTIISQDHDSNSILKYLQQVAVLVQGNWVVNSELIYPQKTFSSHNGVSAELMCRARDYILLSFTENEYVNRRVIANDIKLPSEEIKEIFENLGRLKHKKGWQLLVPPSNDFIKKYPEISQRQDMFWEAKRKQLKEIMESQNHPPQRQRRKSNRESIGSENEERNVGRGRKSLRDSSVSDDGANEPIKTKKTTRSRKASETT